MKRYLDSLLRRLVTRGELTIVWPDGTTCRYTGSPGLKATLRIRDRRALWSLYRDPELTLGEAYMEGWIDAPSGSIADVLALVTENFRMTRPTLLTSALARLRLLTRRLKQWNPESRARQNVAHHYNLDESFYRLFLDSDLQYSCAYFDRPGMTLEQAQEAKKRHIAAKLALTPGAEVLDIGSGWGGMGLFLAASTGSKVTGVTLSTEQHRVSNERAAQAGSAGHVRFELKDYRTLSATFDRIVSVGMFEHVGVVHYDEFFQSCARLLRPDGVMLLHSIGRADVPGMNNPFIEKHIFPGGYIPALSEVFPAIERAGLWVTDVEILRLHYAETLKAWRDRFVSRWQEAARVYDERFCRMWEFYLAMSEAAFRNGVFMNFQIQLTHRRDALPITRDYMAAAERALAASAQPGPLRMAGA